MVGLAVWVLVAWGLFVAVSVLDEALDEAAVGLIAIAASVVLAVWVIGDSIL